MMPVAGIGIDLVDVADMADRLGRDTIRRAFSAREHTYAESRPPHREQIYAANWAAKEAFAKAIGTGIPQSWTNKLDGIEVLRDEDGRPHLELADEFAKHVPAGAEILVSITHTPQTAGAVVVIQTP